MQQGVELGDTDILAFERFAARLVDGQCALDVNLRAGRFVRNNVEHPLILPEQVFVADIRKHQIVHSCHNKDGARLPSDDGVEAGKHPDDTVSADTAVEHPLIREILGPESAFGEAVAEHDDITACYGHEFLDIALGRVVVLGRNGCRQQGGQQ